VNPVRFRFAGRNIVIAAWYPSAGDMVELKVAPGSPASSIFTNTYIRGYSDVDGVGIRLVQPDGVVMLGVDLSTEYAAIPKSPTCAATGIVSEAVDTDVEFEFDTISTKDIVSGSPASDAAIPGPTNVPGIIVLAIRRL